jgi:hypothetical protein
MLPAARRVRVLDGFMVAVRVSSRRCVMASLLSRHGKHARIVRNHVHVNRSRLQCYFPGFEMLWWRPSLLCVDRFMVCSSVSGNARRSCIGLVVVIGGRRIGSM